MPCYRAPLQMRQTSPIRLPIARAATGMDALAVSAAAHAQVTVAVVVLTAAKVAMGPARVLSVTPKGLLLFRGPVLAPARPKGFPQAERGQLS